MVTIPLLCILTKRKIIFIHFIFHFLLVKLHHHSYICKQNNQSRPSRRLRATTVTTAISFSVPLLRMLLTKLNILKTQIYLQLSDKNFIKLKLFYSFSLKFSFSLFILYFQPSSPIIIIIYFNTSILSLSSCHSRWLRGFYASICTYFIIISIMNIQSFLPEL